MRKCFVECCGLRPLGTPRDLQVLACGVSRDPGFSMVAAPLLRWHREIWSATSKHGNKVGDLLSQLEIWQVWHNLWQIGEGDVVTQGPLKGLQAALDHFGWKYTGPLEFTTKDGFALDLESVSTVMLRKSCFGNTGGTLKPGWTMVSGPGGSFQLVRKYTGSCTQEP